jgi:EAL domain-containing protein (putative c-di-GMP-specific phosphodiesterase class I)
VDSLKIDRGFVAHLTGPGGRSEIVQTIIALARGLEMSVIAEGIETAPQRAHLRELGCESGQGFLISPPLDRQAATTLIASAARRRRREAAP